jgi:hypothetical protein
VSVAELPIPGPIFFDHCSPFMEDAIDTRDLALIRNVKARGGIGNCHDTQRAVYAAIRDGDIEGMMALVAAGVDANAPLIGPLDGCYPPLAYAFQQRTYVNKGEPFATDTTILKLLLEGGADPNEHAGPDWHEASCYAPGFPMPSGPRAAPLMAAVLAGDVEFARLLIDAGADVTQRDHRGRSYLDYVSMSLRPENRDSMTTLLSAAMVSR